ncbi:Verru_Chthon cassette protein A [Prosthecobacter sp.]|uniref:Verru_Chthon cassette protein A n=1 Tax=Prosthecobacter sp. TaxID=1965333 RepID=UPI002AB8824A|nr:Verru_Chthon cassette protein A [Prosthecobacter sp.]MDZ4403378.1 Verru_Chthon cassette protein A [Prosthecobacter sp.]
MNAKHLTSPQKKRRHAMALIMVITTVALLSILMVAIFSLTQTEYKATQSYVAGRSAKQLADTAVSVVEAQIQNGHFDPVNNSQEYSYSNRTFHATQPGMVRVYNANGTFKSAYKLYSSSQMKVTGSNEALVFGSAHQIPANWKEKNARFVDLNEPVIRPSLTAGAPAVYFPVIDPRAGWNYLGSQTPSAGQPDSRVEGFSYAKKTASGAGTTVTYSEVVLPADAQGDDSRLRLPMPVEWMYVLQDGTLGALDETDHFVSSTGIEASADNPIVGRIAFWTDDESCKVNINTASEPTFMGTPFYFNDRDRMWAHFTAATGEYQRYPGHPATVALSSVLAPNIRLDPYLPGSGVTTSQILDIKEYIYAMTPKIAGGGSLAGTRPFARDDVNVGETAALAIDSSTARSERLYASVDEMLFKDGDFVSKKGRQPARYEIAGGRVLFDHDVLERSRFFLTAHSRAPEFSIFGLPRICMWPVDENENKNNEKRTNFDNMIALCSSIKGVASTSGGSVEKSYIFRRSRSYDSTYDLKGTNGLQRNSQLLDYLAAQMSGLSWPRTTTNLGNSLNYATKYGADNVNQLAVQFFDYIRCTNLYDGVLSRSNDGRDGNNKSGTALYNTRDTTRPKAVTFTDQRLTRPATSMNVDETRSDDTGVLPGHGQVSPAVWGKSGKSYKGFGRMFTLSEVGIQVICTADGKNDPNLNPAFGPGRTLSGGGSSVRIDPAVNVEPGQPQPPYTWAEAYPGMTPPAGAGTARWYSNFPPLVATQNALLYGTTIDPAHPEWHPSKHPAYYPENWNMTLAADTPLTETQKRVQAIILLEAFCPSVGWTKFFPEYTIVLDGDYIGQIKLDNKRIFDTTGSIAVKSDANIYDSTTGFVSPLGGHAGPSVICGNRGGRPVSGEGQVMLGSDRNYDTSNPTGHNALANYGMTSNFLTVNRDTNMSLTFPTGEFVIKLYDTHNWESSQPIQIIRIQFSDAGATSLPTPGLTGAEPGSGVGNPWLAITEDQYGRRRYTRARQGPHYWCYNFEGCFGQMTGRINPNYGKSGESMWIQPPRLIPAGVADNRVQQSLRGRLDTGAAAATPAPPYAANGVSIIPDGVSDVTRTFIPTMGDYRILAAMYDVPATYWQPHPGWQTSVRSVHSFTNFSGNSVAGSRLAVPASSNLPSVTVPTAPAVDTSLQLVYGANYNLLFDNNNNPTGRTVDQTSGDYNRRQPDLPGQVAWARAAQSFGDFDTGLTNTREGPYINKPDEGNFYVGNQERGNITKRYRSAYFFDSWEQNDDWRSGIYMTPNRLISSPVMFGSLPTQAWKGGSIPAAASPATTDYKPWQTLLFRPHSNYSGVGGSKTTHPGEYNPKDHFLLDMFFMPVVEPYAISEPLSVAGRVNMNYQIMPFTHITRATGMHAVMKGEFMTAVPLGHINKSKSFKPVSGAGAWDDNYWNEKNDSHYWHRPIDVTETLRQFEERFANNTGLNTLTRGLFRAASQICEIYLVPEDKTGPLIGNVSKPMNSPSIRKSSMDSFWSDNRATGDNVRERPYSNLYSRLTTRSNTFRVHVRAQMLRKARSTAPDVFNPSKDAVLSEYRGSTLIERYIDPNNSPDIPDYAGSAGNPLTSAPLESFYRFRALESKRFSP